MARMFNFAWVDATETTFDPVTHAREDARVYSYEFNQSEGDFATLRITILNPRKGLLAPSRKRWLWFSALIGGVQTPLFFGRLNGIPPNFYKNTIEIEFIGRPADYVDQKMTLAETLKELPYWDPLFIRDDALDDPDVVLEARSALWHIDPVTHEVTISDLIVGEDGIVEFTADDYYDSGIELSIGQTPARSVTVSATINWDNQGAGRIDLTGLISGDGAWASAGPSYPGLISSYTFMGLFNDWPQDQTTYSGGWYVAQSYLINVTGQNVPPVIKKEPQWGEVFVDYPANLPEGSLVLRGMNFGQSVGIAQTDIETDTFGSILSQPVSVTYVPLGWGMFKYVLGYSASREYSEKLTLVLTCDVQDVVTLPGEDEAIRIDVNSNKASEYINGVIPIGDVGRRSYIDSDRGKQSLAYLILCARAALVAKARTVNLSITTNFANGIACTLRKNALVYNERFPGGQILGKITAIKHALDGATGALLYQITLASAVGRGGSYTASLGDPTYVEEGYVTAGYQQYENVIDVLSTEDVSYSITPYEPNDDGIDFSSPLSIKDVVKYFAIENGPGVQADLVLGSITSDTPGQIIKIAQTYYDESTVREIIQEHPTRIHLEMKPLTTGPFETAVEVTLSDLVIPKQIDLEAESTP